LRGGNAHTKQKKYANERKRFHNNFQNQINNRFARENI
jgi:hypothetical protein